MAIAFLKFGSNEEHLANFVEKGEVYINSADFFRKKDKKSMIFDEHELADSYHQPEGAKITIARREFNIVAPFSTRYGGDSFTHIYCLHTVKNKLPQGDEENRVFDPKIWNDFGEYVVLIHQPALFLDRLFVALQSVNVRVAESREIEYFNEKTYHGDTGPFKKRALYSYQREFRVSVKSMDAVSNPIILNMGCINDIAYGPVHKSHSVNRFDKMSALI